MKIRQTEYTNKITIIPVKSAQRQKMKYSSMIRIKKVNWTWQNM